MAWFNRGVACGRLERPEEALASFERLIALQQDNADAWHYRGLALRELGRHDEARASLQRAHELGFQE